ncbi:MAG: hypothetical protein GZ090_10465 [Oxalobacteraceae bacterium]|jgi:6-phosphogluconate dehydrogenase (decarboxylating)|nr:hypothetical protein [Oxalobacteraceae bacterium]
MPELQLLSNGNHHVRVMVPGRMLASRGEADFANQLLSAMRNAFGDHLEKPAGETR